MRSQTHIPVGTELLTLGRMILDKLEASAYVLESGADALIPVAGF